MNDYANYTNFTDNNRAAKRYILISHKGTYDETARFVVPPLDVDDELFVSVPYDSRTLALSNLKLHLKMFIPNHGKLLQLPKFVSFDKTKLRFRVKIGVTHLGYFRSLFEATNTLKQGKKNDDPGVKGVTYDKDRARYRATLHLYGQSKHVGFYAYAKSAVAALNRAKAQPSRFFRTKAKFPGVYRQKDGRYKCMCYADGKAIYLGYRKTPEQGNELVQAFKKNKQMSDKLGFGL